MKALILCRYALIIGLAAAIPAGCASSENQGFGLTPQSAPRVGAASSPLASNGYGVSIYVSTLNHSTLYNEGCETGRDDTSVKVVILDFGQPWQLQDGTYGTALVPAPHKFASIQAILKASEAYIDGWAACVAPSSGYALQLYAGTNNYKSRKGKDYVTPGHGAAWGQMAAALEMYAGNMKCPTIVGYPCFAYGASDIELDYDTAAESKKWVSAYLKAAYNKAGFANYGNAAGCPPYGGCNNHWTPQDVFDVSKAGALPEIYSTNGHNADQWAYLASHYTTQGTWLNGITTQYAACKGREKDPTCKGLNNTPSQAWNQMNQRGYDLTYSTDFTYVNGGK